MNLNDLKQKWTDTEEYHKHIHETFCALVNADPELKAHRDFVQDNIFGFGERSFWWLWILLLSELPENPKLLEIGCLKGATLSLWKQLRPQASVFGVTPLSTAGGVWDDDYMAAIKLIHGKFNNGHIPFLFVGLSEDEKIIVQVKDKTPFDLIYVDGSHTYDGVMNDLVHYSPLVKVGGYLVMDDCCTDFKMPFGYFQGIKEVQDAFDAYMCEHSKDWEFITNVVHLRVLRRK